MQNKQTLLLDQLDQKIFDFNKDSKRHKLLYRRLRYSVFILSSVSAVLAGLSLKLPDHGPSISVAILIVSAIVGIITSIEGIRKPAELWIHERTTYHALMDLQREVVFSLDDNSPPELIEKYFFRFQDLLGASAEKWNRQVSRVPNPAGAPSVSPEISSSQDSPGT